MILPSNARIVCLFNVSKAMHQKPNQYRRRFLFSDIAVKNFNLTTPLRGDFSFSSIICAISDLCFSDK